MKLKKLKESDLPYIYGTHRDNYNRTEQSVNQSIAALAQLKRILETYDLPLTREMVQSIATDAYIYEVTKYIEQKMLDENPTAGVWMRKKIIEDARSTAAEIIQELRSTEVNAPYIALRIQYKDTIDWSNATQDFTAAMDSVIDTHTYRIKTVEGMQLYNKHIELLEAINAFAKMGKETLHPDRIFDFHNGEYMRPHNIDYDFMTTSSTIPMM